MAQCNLVIGLARSGTSLVTAILDKLGINMMGGNPSVPSPFNKYGSFEDPEFNEALYRIIGSFPKLAPINPSSDLDRFYALFDARDGEGKPWGFKSLNTEFLLHEICQRHQDVKIIMLRRPFNESVNSYMALIGNADIYQIINQFCVRLYAMHEACSHVGITPLLVDFHDLLANPTKVVGLISEYVGVPVTQAAIDLVDPEFSKFGRA